MSYCRSEEEKKKLQTRLNRIEGQVRGIAKMIESQRECVEILNQLTSCQSALKGVWKEVVRGHLQNCIKKGLNAHQNADSLIDELIEHLEKMK